MVVYVEIVFLNNLAINMVICLSVYKVQKIKLSWGRIIGVSILGAVAAVFYPKIAQYSLLVRLTLSFVMVLLLIKYQNIWQALTALALFYLITFCLAGAVFMLSTNNYLQKFDKIIEFAPTFIALGIFLAYFLLSFITRELYAFRQKYNLEYNVDISSAYGHCQTKAYYDSGNCVYDADCQPVVIISDKIYNQLKGGNEQYLSVSTIGGVQLIKIIKVELKIYQGADSNKIFNISAGISANLKKNYDVILHVDLIGG